MIPRVLVAADSIAWPLGYGPSLRKKLDGVFDVKEIPEDTVWFRKMRPDDVKDQPFKTSENLLEHVYEWLIEPDYEIVYLNCGLHDLCRMGGPGEDPVVPLRRYRYNLDQIACRLKTETHSKLIWATITPIREKRGIAHKKRKDSTFFRYTKDVNSYNRTSLKLMKEHNFNIVDLHGLVMKEGLEKCIAVDGVHLTKNFGRVCLAKSVSNAINSCWWKKSKISRREANRVKQLDREIPDIWEHKKVLYVGASLNRFHFKNKLRENMCIVDVLEISGERCEGLETLTWLNQVIHGDVRDVDTLVDSKYDLVLWSHGPEMIEANDVTPTINKLLQLTKELIVLMCPWGKYWDEYPSSTPSENVSKTPLYVEYFTKLGFKTSTQGKMNVRGSNLLAWKRVN